MNSLMNDVYMPLNEVFISNEYLLSAITFLTGFLVLIVSRLVKQPAERELLFSLSIALHVLGSIFLSMVILGVV